MSNKLQYLNGANFHDYLQAAKVPVIVDFYADWCGPCKTLAPGLEVAAGRYAEELSVVKVHVDANPELAQEFGIRSIPTLLVFKAGALAEQRVGAPSERELASLIERQIG